MHSDCEMGLGSVVSIIVNECVKFGLKNDSEGAEGQVCRDPKSCRRHERFSRSEV